MIRHGLFAAAAGAALFLTGCDTRVPPPSPPPCDPIPRPRGAEELPDDTVFGFADLHAHPAIEVAFDHRLVWGNAVDDSAPVDATELPRIEPCPVETHARDATSPLDRPAGSEVFSALAQSVGFAHAPVGSVSGSALVDAWPNARDLVHQQMNVSSIRRAYEGGLRLLFASPTDDQLMSAVLGGPSFVNGFVPSRGADDASARRQLDAIVAMVARNSTWMSVVHSPREAREAIRAGRLAVVLSLEMNGLREEDVNGLVRDYGVSSMLPIHLINNDVGGTALAGDIFNTSSSAVSELYCAHPPLDLIHVSPAAEYARTLHRPSQIGTFDQLPIYVSPSEVPYATYQPLCYEPLDGCSGAAVAPASFLEFGQKNSQGLWKAGDCAGEAGADRIAHLMDLGLLVDVSHMSAAAVSDTLDGVPGRGAYPLIASHGDVAHLCDEPASSHCKDDLREPVSEREIDAAQARRIVQRGGVLGFGTATGKYGARALVAARGGPLFTLRPADPEASPAAACVARRGAGAPGCETAANADLPSASVPVDSLSIHTVHTLAEALAGSGPAQPVARVELRGPSPQTRYERHVIIAPLECGAGGCSATVPLGDRIKSADPAPWGPQCASAGGTSSAAPYTLDDLESVTLEWLYGQCDLDCQSKWGGSIADRQCSSTWDDDQAPIWTVHEASLSASWMGKTFASVAELGPRDAPPLARLGRKRGGIVLYRRDDRPGAAADVRASGHLLKVSLTSSPDSKPLAGANPASRGANVCVAVRSASGGACPEVPPPPAGTSECPEGWSRLNQRGEWGPGTTLFTFARFSGAASDVCGLDVAVLDWDPRSEPFSVDEVRVEAIEDPVGRWVRRYAAIAREVAGGHLGAVALGTDFNGLNGTTDISEFPAPLDVPAPSACNGQSSPQPLAPLQFRNANGTLGDKPVLIEERGLATYGLLADMLAIVERYPECGKDVHDSLMLSAEATLRAWEKIVEPDKIRPPLPWRAFECDPQAGGSP